MAACRALIALALMSLPALAADELPKELLLQCEGKMNAVLDAPKPETRRLEATRTIGERIWRQYLESPPSLVKNTSTSETPRSTRSNLSVLQRHPR